MFTRFVLVVTLTLAFISGCATTCEREKGCDPFDQVIQKNWNKMPESGSKNDSSFDAAFIASGKGVCIRGSKAPCPYDQEALYLKDHWPPKLGLSLSGGGTRAASFSIGVMKALKETHKLDQVELISSVSGGSYANYWYFSQLFYRDRLSKLNKTGPLSTDIFMTWNDSGTNLEDPDQYRFQRTLEESSEILGYAHKPSFTKDARVGLQYGVQTFIQGLSIPVHWLFNGLFDWEVNVTPYYYFYKDGLDRTYGYVPLDYTLDHFANARPNSFGFDNVDAEPILLGDMKSFLETAGNKKLPYFVINTTARLGRVMDRDGKDKERSMENSLLEFTPWGCHSELLKFHPPSKDGLDCPLMDFHLEFNRAFGTKELDLARIVATSGAAVDGQTQFVDVSGREENAYQILGKTWLEIGLDVVNLNLGYTSQNQDTPVWQRRFHKLLPWPLYLAHDYLLSLGDSDRATSVHLSDGGHSENLGILPLIRRGTECIIAVDSEYDPDSVFESAKRLSQTLKRHGLKIRPFMNKDKPINEELINVHNLKHGVEDAVTEWEIVKKDGTLLEKPIRIIYIKLSTPSKYDLDNKNSEKLPYTVTSYLREHPDFPHESTADVFYEPEQFRAYRDLGYTIAKQYFSSNDQHMR